MNDGAPILGENVSISPEPKNEIDEYAVAVTTGARVIDHLKKGNTGRYVKTDFDFLRANPMNAARITVTGKSVNLEMGKVCKFPAQFYSREKKYILKF